MIAMSFQPKALNLSYKYVLMKGDRMYCKLLVIFYLLITFQLQIISMIFNIFYPIKVLDGFQGHNNEIHQIASIPFFFAYVFQFHSIQTQKQIKLINSSQIMIQKIISKHNTQLRDEQKHSTHQQTTPRTHKLHSLKLIFFQIIIIQRFMAYAEFIQVLDRLTVKSVLRGSTSTVLGILGTLAVFILCLALYIPPTVKYFQGNYFESQFWVGDLVNQNFYSNDDFKIAIQLRKRSDNSVANHTFILSWAYSEFAQLYANQMQAYIQPSATCYPNYLADAINPVYLQDCFIFPQHKLFDAFAGYGVYTAYTNIFYWLYPHKDLNPFYAQLSGNRAKMDQLLKDYYYIVYFTSKITDPKTGKQSFQINRYYSTDSDYSENVGSTVDIMIYNVKNYTLDISIMPWINNITTNGLMWLGQTQTLYQLTLEATSQFGIQVDFSLQQYSVMSYRYYKKLDWLLGIIGGAMLLFYIILWVPCNFINKTIHQMNNVNQLLLINHANEEEPITQDKVTAANVSSAYWFSNFPTRKFISSVQNADRLVQAGQKELDIVRLIKKIKVAERSLTKKKILVPFQPKILKLETIKIGDQNEQEDESGMQEDNQSQQIVQNQIIVQDDVVEIPTDPTFGILQRQMNLLKDDQTLKNAFENNMTAAVIRGDADHSMRLKQMQFKNKMSAIYPSKRKTSRAKIVWNALVNLIKYIDLFGARPNLVASPYSSSLLGLCGVILILLCSLLVCALTLKNANVPQFMILDSYQDQNHFGYSLTTGSSLKFALCFDRASSLIGTNKMANLQFFTNSKKRGLQYIQPVKLTSADYAKFDLTSSTSPVDISYCFGLEPGHEVLMGQNGTNFGYFGFKVEPYCSLTAAYCSSNAATINSNFLSFINSTYVYLFLPENRFDPFTNTFKNRLVYQQLNLNLRYMRNISALEETLFVDQVRIEDDTKNWFMRKKPEIKAQGIAQNQYTSYPLSRNILGSPYYTVKIKPSGNQIRYLVSTNKADTILAILGGVFVLFYAVFHWIGKLYNTFNVKAKLAEVIYDQQSINESPLIKLLAMSRIPTCMIPARFGFKYDVARVRQVQKKMNYDLNYLWLVKYVENIFNLSAAIFNPPFARMQAKNLSLVFVKEKIDQSEQATNRVVRQQSRHNQQEFNEEIEIGREMEEKGNFYDKKKKHNKILNESSVINISDTNLQESLPDQKIKVTQQVLDITQDAIQQRIQDNHLHGNPKQPRFNMLDTFEYPASLTLNGQREVTSFCGGCCCLIMTILIVLVAKFQVGIYLNRSDMRVGMSTEIMQPLSTQSNSTFNSKLAFNTGRDFKLAITFSSNYADYPHNVSNWTSVGISVFQQTFTHSAGKILSSTVEYPFIPCNSDYLKPTDPMIDPEYYKNTQYGYCIPDGITLEISGIPQDLVNKRFTLSIFNKVGTKAANQQLKTFMQIYLPKIHFTSPTLDFTSKKLKYDIQSFTFDAFNVTYPISQNISFAKMNVLFDDQIAFQGDPYETTTYVAMPFQQFQTAYVDTVTSMMSYNLSFANSYTVFRYTVVGDKFYQTFGVIGGLVAFFIFAFGVFPRGFNQYRMQYLIGKQLYLFDILKKKQAMAAARGRKRKSKEQLQSLSDFNDMSEAQLLLAYFMSFFGMLFSDYNINTTLRRVTLIQQRVIKDINLFEVYKKIHNIRDALNKHLRSDSVKLTNIHLKHIYNPDPDSHSLVEPAKIVSFAKKHCWSTFEQYAVFDALKGRVNLKEVFDNGFLQKAFNMEGLDRNSIHLSQFGGTQGSIGTTSVVESIAQPSQIPKQETFDIE